MKTDSHSPFVLAPPQEGAILEEIRNDHELVARLKITPEEIQALSKCALLGRLSCKEDMLFILRQIREVTSPSSSGIFAFPEPAAYSEDEEREDPILDFRQVQSGLAAHSIPEPAFLDGTFRRRLLVQFGIPFLLVMVAAVLFWKNIITMSRWRDIFMTSVRMPVSWAPTSEVWFNHLDRFSVLLLWEALLVVGIIGVIYFRSLRSPSRLKVRPGRG
jgi:hypothetical protein